MITVSKYILISYLLSLTKNIKNQSVILLNYRLVRILFFIIFAYLYTRLFVDIIIHNVELMIFLYTWFTWFIENLFWNCLFFLIIHIFFAFFPYVFNSRHQGFSIYILSCSTLSRFFLANNLWVQFDCIVLLLA